MFAYKEAHVLQGSSPPTGAAFHPWERPVWLCWRLDETAIKVQGVWRPSIDRVRQRQCAAAALELILQQPGQPLFEVRAPGFRQQQSLRRS